MEMRFLMKTGWNVVCSLNASHHTILSHLLFAFDKVYSVLESTGVDQLSKTVNGCGPLRLSFLQLHIGFLLVRIYQEIFVMNNSCMTINFAVGISHSILICQICNHSLGLLVRNYLFLKICPNCY
jgi:hypothetical protein